jgi:hypothetical protein
MEKYDYDIYSVEAKLISINSNFNNYRKCFLYPFLDKKKLYNLIPEIKKYLREISFDDSALKILVKSVNKVNYRNQNERGGGIYFKTNSTIPQVYFREIDAGEGGAGSNYFPIENIINFHSFDKLIGVVHTHPTEGNYLKSGFTEKNIFGWQYEIHKGKEGDGIYIQEEHYPAKKFMLYSVGYKEADFYSPEGKSSSKNGLCLNESILSGDFNLLKHALHMYGEYHAPMSWHRVR